MTDYVVDFNLDDEDLNADFELDEGEVFNAVLQLDVVGSLWGNISGDIHNQTDLQSALDLKADKSEVESVTGALADSIQAVDNKYDSITGGLDDSITAIDNKYDSITGALDDKIDSINGALSDDIDALESVVSANFTTLSDSISAETTARQNADSIIGDSITALDNKFDSITGGLSDSITALDSVVSANYNTLSDSITSGLATKQDTISDLSTIRSNAANGNTAYNTIQTYGDIVNYNAAYFATSLQGALADTALQPNDNISELNNDAGYITSASLPTVNNATITIQKNGTTVESFTLNQSTNETVNITVPTSAADVNALPDTTTINDLTTSTQQAALNSGANTTNIGQIATNTQNISDEVTARQNADNGLQSQIDALVVASDVFDIVGTYAELQAYDISTVPVNDIIKVLVDSTHNDAATYYRCVETGGVKSWSYIGSEGAYYTKGEADAAFVPQSRTINGYALSNNITLSYADVNALPDSTVIPTVNNSTITIQKNGAAVDTFTLNQATAKTINITVPTDTSDLTNRAGFISGIDSVDVTTALGYTPYNSTNPNGYITSSALNGYATENFVTSQGYITGINSTDVINALGYTPYSNANPDGFITSAALANYLQKDVAQSTTGTLTFVGQKKILFKQSSSSDKLGFTLYNSSNTELGALEYRPNTISGAALLNINCPYTADYVGFRYWGTAVNIIAPKVSTAGDYYIPVNITDGNTTVTASNTGSVNISSLLPDISGKQNTLTAGSNITISGDTISATDTTYSDFTGADSITAGSSGLVPAPSAGDNDKILTGGATWEELKTVNSTSLLGNGNIDTSEIFVATYGTTTYQEITDALVAGKYPICEVMGTWGVYSSSAGHKHNFTNYYNGVLQNLYVNSSNVWNYEDLMPADTTLSNVSSIDSGSAVQSALNGKVNKSGDTMTGGLAVENNIYIKYAGNKYFVVQNTSANYTNTTAPSSSVAFGGSLVQDVNGNTFGGYTLSHNISNNVINTLYARRSINGTEYTSALVVGVGVTGTAYATAPRTPPTSSNDANIATTSFVRHVVQSGEVSISANSEATVTFPYGFPNANVTVVVSRRAGASTTAVLYPCYVRGEPTASSFKVYNPTNGSQTVPWIAVYKG